MSRQALHLRRTGTILWRHKVMVGALVALGIAGGASHTVAQPQVYSSSVVITCSPSVSLSTQTVVVTSVPVLAEVLRTADLGIPLKTLRHRIAATPTAMQAISVTAQGNSAQQAERTANAIARSYMAYVGSARNPDGRQPAELLQPATTAAAKPRATQVLLAAGLGGLTAAVVALIAALAIWGNDGRLDERADIADSIGVPVLASLRAHRRRNAAAWLKLLGGYAPGAADAWQLQRVLRRLRQHSGGPADTTSVAVLSLSGDSDALALGPQLAAYAASCKIPTALVVSPQQASGATAALRAACSMPEARGLDYLRFLVGGQGDSGESPQALTVIVSVVHRRLPRVGQTIRADVTLLAVTAAAATAEQLTRVLASAAGDGRAIAGALVANPVPGDQTTGHLPRIAGPGQVRMPTRMVGAPAERRR